MAGEGGSRSLRRPLLDCNFAIHALLHHIVGAHRADAKGVIKFRRKCHRGGAAARTCRFPSCASKTQSLQDGDRLKGIIKFRGIFKLKRLKRAGEIWQVAPVNLVIVNSFLAPFASSAPSPPSAISIHAA